MAKQQFKKPSKYITFASGWVDVDDDGSIKKIGCNAAHKGNAKSNKGEGYKVFVVPVDDSGEQQGEPIEVNSFVVFPSGADKGQYPEAPDFRVFFGVD